MAQIGSGNKVGKSRVSLLVAVNKPLTFFALVVLVIEATTLVLIGRQGDEMTKHILATGMVAALILAIVVVFVLVLLPQTRSYFLGEPEPMQSFAADVTDLRLSGNDYRMIRAVSKRPNRPANSYQSSLTDSDKGLEQRIKLLVKEGFIQLQYPGVFLSELQLTGKGRNLAEVIGRIESALADLPND
jgi:hypothetical protein